MKSLQSLNSKRYKQTDVEEGKQYLQNGIVPFRIQHHATRAKAFQDKWENGTIIGDKVLIGGKEVIPKETVPSVLARVYADPSQQAGRDKLHHKLQQNYIGISRRCIMAFLKNQETHQVHQPKPKRTINQASVILNAFSRLQIDLIDMSTLAKINNGDHWILSAVDSFTKVGHAIPLKSKSGPAVFTGIQNILLSLPQLPLLIQSDNGSEFLTKQLKHWFQEHAVKHIRSDAYKPSSNGNVERFNGTLKRMMYRHMSQFSTKKWNDVLPLLLTNYNTSLHSSTGCTPNELQQAALDNDEILLTKARQKITARAIKMLTDTTMLPDIQIGDIVRISLHTLSDIRKDSHRKKFLANWSKALYVVVSISAGSAWQNPQYKIKSRETDRIVRKRFYKSDLQLVPIESLQVNEKPRPDYSEGNIFNQEEHIRQVQVAGPLQQIIKPPTQLEEREKGSRIIRARPRLINELLLQMQERESVRKKK